ncbi:MAG: N-acetyltransferase [Pseudomonadales bacterium]|nr:N-acetyltransferase [Pseudomonadales bacterium]
MSIDIPGKCVIRSETPEDYESISEVIRRAFDGRPYAAGNEAELVVALREQGGLAVSLVAELDGNVVGQAAFSPVTASDGTDGWYAVGPIAVVPGLQQGGIGGQLMRAGLDAIGKLGAVGCILTGDPNYYCRFGFEPAPAHAPPEEPAEFFQVKRLRDVELPPVFHFHPAFYT